jgi:hypothetical protein
MHPLFLFIVFVNFFPIPSLPEVMCKNSYVNPPAIPMVPHPQIQLITGQKYFKNCSLLGASGSRL